MLGGAEAAAAGFALGNVAYVAQLLAKPRQRSDGDPYALLRGLSAYRASDGALVPVTSAWSADQKAVPPPTKVSLSESGMRTVKL